MAAWIRLALFFALLFAASLRARDAKPPFASYEVRPDKEGWLVIEARLAAPVAPRLSFESEVSDAVQDFVFIDDKQREEPIALEGTLPRCRNRNCHFRYRLKLDTVVAKGGDEWTAARLGDYTAIAFDHFLIVPTDWAASAEARVHFTRSSTVDFATGLATDSGAPAGTYHFRAKLFHDIPFLLLGPLRKKTFSWGKASLDLVWEKGADAPGQSLIFDWTEKAARAVTAYYGKFPAEHALVYLRAGEGHGMADGKSFGEGGALITGTLGTATTARDFKQDWVLTHEMVHHALPSLPRSHHWLEEGLATYVEPFARLEVGQLTPEKVWRDLVEGLPKGVPGPDSRGLDHDGTWASTYWGGSLFCFLADREISRRTHQRLGLRDALRAILNETGGMAHDSSIVSVLSIGDHAVGVPVLEDLYRKMKDRRLDVDLAKIWQDLGIKLTPKGVAFDEKSAESPIRRSLSSRP